MDTLPQHTRPPPFPIVDPKNAHLSGQREEFFLRPRVSLGSQFFLTHPMLPGATSSQKNPCKCLDIMTISDFRLSYIFSRLHAQPCVIATDITCPPVIHPRRPARPLSLSSLQLCVIATFYPVLITQSCITLCVLSMSPPSTSSISASYHE